MASSGKRVIFRIETPAFSTASTKTLPCKEGETVVCLKAAMMGHLLASAARSDQGHSETPLMPDRYLFAHMPTGQLFMDFTPIEWVVKATGQENKKVKQLSMLCLDVGREESSESMRARQQIVDGEAAIFEPEPEQVMAEAQPTESAPSEAMIKAAKAEVQKEVKKGPGTGGCGTIFTCTACTSDSWSKLQNKGTMPCSVCEIDSSDLFVCGGCGTEVCIQCIHPDAKLQCDDDDSDSEMEKYDVDDYVDTRRWKTKELTLSPGELGIMFGPRTFRNRFDTSYNAEPEVFICVHELDDDSQCLEAAQKVFTGRRQLGDTLPWIITELNGQAMPNAGQKATGNTDDEVDDDIDVIFEEMQKACNDEKPYTMKVLYLDEVSRALGASRSAARRGARRC